MLRALMALLVGGALFAAAFGAAAGLTVTGGTVQQGTDSATCDTSVSVAYDAGLVNGKVNSVTVGGIDSVACSGDVLSVELLYGTPNSQSAAADSVACENQWVIAATSHTFDVTSPVGGPAAYAVSTTEAQGPCPASIGDVGKTRVTIASP